MATIVNTSRSLGIDSYFTTTERGSTIGRETRAGFTTWGIVSLAK